MKVKAYFLTTVSSIAFAGIASAADLPVVSKAPPMAVAPVNWAGGYIGVHAGVARLNYSQTTFQENGNCGDEAGVTCTSSATGAVVGGQIGYNWQSQEFVYGIEADGSWADLKNTETFQNDPRQTVTGKVDWLASVRGRAGLAFNRTLVYATAGVAFAGIKSGWTACCDGGAYSSNLDKTKVGWVAGFGVEHMLAPNWTARLEALYYDLGRATASTTSPNGHVYTTNFNHEIFAVRIGANYKW